MCKGWVLASASPGNLWPFFFKYHVMSCSGPETRCVCRRRAPTEHVTLNQMHIGRAPSVIYTFWFLSKLRGEMSSRRAHELASYWRHRTDKRVRRKREKMRRVKPTDGQTDGPTCHADLYYFCPLRKRERGDESRRTCVEVTGVCPSPLRLLHLCSI